MRIDNAHLTAFPLGQPGETPASDETMRRDGPERNLLQPGFHTPSTELTGWVGLTFAQPEIRQEVVQQVAERLAAGHYGTLEAAQQTAAAILQANE